MDETELAKKKTDILNLMDTIQTLGLERVPIDAKANDVLCALMNLILQAVEGSGKVENVEACREMFNEMSDMIVKRLTPEVPNE
jgi:hypothetical protein